jgi:hypothetical protein
MLKSPMIEKLAAMRLLGMVEALKTREHDPTVRELSFSERSACWWINSGTGGRIKRSGHD